MKILISELISETKSVFFKKYGTEPLWLVAAPGRVNLIGEHTDYNDGFVFPIAIERYTVIAAGHAEHDKHDDHDAAAIADIYSINKEESATIQLDGLATPPQTVVWSSYVQGTVQNVIEAGLRPKNFRAVINSNVPLGAGLSSSASLEIATATLLEAITGQKLDSVQKALLCQKAEHFFIRMPCGIMDQFISAMGREGYAMLLDCRSCVPKMIPLDDSDITVLIINSNVKHELTGSEYPDRRRQCEKAAQLLNVPKLRDATLQQLKTAQSVFDKEPDGTICFRRAYHIITENDRTVTMADAIVRKDWKTCGKLMYESHASMRDDFEITCAEIDLLVEIAQSTDGVIGSRMTGGGFGGCTVSLVESSKVDKISKTISEQYCSKTGIEPVISVTHPAQGAMILDSKS
ncbi:MAG: galactokinase [Planctomycetaceae bacterium]|jgi:galactokinase|nr:galactokinase [Planctomycetaceae bacterium]